jgi:hypothetical protein
MTTTPERHDKAVLAARARWGEQRVLRLDRLTAEQRRLVLALLSQTQKEPDDGGQSTGSGAEGQHHGATAS